MPVQMPYILKFQTLRKKMGELQKTTKIVITVKSSNIDRDHIRR